MRKLLVALFLLGLTPFAQAQQVNLYCSTGSGFTTWQPASSANPCPVGVSISPSGSGKTTTQTKVTIAVTNTYQTALASSSTRSGCTIQYIPASTSNLGYVFFGSSPADTTTSFQFGSSRFAGMTCAVGGITVATDAIQVTGTSGDIFIISSQ